MNNDNTQRAYVAYDGDGDEIATCATYGKAKDAIRDHISWDNEHQRDLGTLATWGESFACNGKLPFSGCEVGYVASDDRHLALARAMDIDLDDISDSRYSDPQLDAGSMEFIVRTDEEAQALAMEQCREHAWAFNVDFLSHYLPKGGYEALTAMRDSGLCEDANDAVIALLGDRADKAFSDAIDCDGRAHFLASYDGHETEYEIGGVTYFIYRTN